MTKEHKSLLRENKEDLAGNMSPEEVVNKLYGLNILTQKEVS